VVEVVDQGDIVSCISLLQLYYLQRVPTIVCGSIMADLEMRRICWHEKARHVTIDPDDVNIAVGYFLGISPHNGLQPHHNVLIIGISGHSRCGKSTLTSALRARFGPSRCATIRCDHFFIDSFAEAEKRYTLDDPGAMDHTVILAQARSSAAALSSMSRATTPREVGGMPILIIEGFMAFWDPVVVSMMHQRIWLDVGNAELRRRRVTTTPTSGEYYDQWIKPNADMYEDLVFRRNWGIARIPGTSSPDEIEQQALRVIHYDAPGTATL
jgi:uridine kinase